MWLESFYVFSNRLCVIDGIIHQLNNLDSYYHNYNHLVGYRNIISHLRSFVRLNVVLLSHIQIYGLKYVNMKDVVKVYFTTEELFYRNLIAFVVAHSYIHE